MISRTSPTLVARNPVRYATVLTTQFDLVAETVADRVAELLCAPVWITDERAAVVARAVPSLAAREQERFEQPYEAHLHAPLHIDGQAGAVLVGPPLNGEAISPRLARVLVQLVVGQALALDRLPDRQERKNAFIRDLLQGTLRDEATILREASILGMDLAMPRSVLLIDASDYILAPTRHGVSECADAAVLRRAQLVIGSVVSFFHLPNDTICAYIGGGEVAVLKASNTRNLVLWAGAKGAASEENSGWANLAALKRAGEELLDHMRADTGSPLGVGIGRYHPGLRGIARSYEDARAALSIGRRQRGQNRVHCLDGLGIAAFVGVSDERTKVELATHLLSPLDHEPELLATLEAFFTCNCCPSSTAGRLAIHRNTLGYRLQKIASLTGLDPRRFEEAMQIRLALLMRSFRAEASS
jgi:carbohydrate diacid regulator